MKFYLTVESQEKIRKTFINLNAFYILDVQELLDSLHLDMTKPSNIFYVNQEIEHIIAQQAKSKRLEGIIYINKNLTESIIDHLFNFVVKLPKMENMVLLDEQIFPKLQPLHHLFEEVCFFPVVRRVKIVECKTLKPFENEDSSSNTLDMIKELEKG